MKQFKYIFVCLCLATSCFAQYEGPYLLFGPKSLDELHVPSLQGKIVLSLVEKNK